MPAPYIVVPGRVFGEERTVAIAGPFCRGRKDASAYGKMVDADWLIRHLDLDRQ